jgi:hypothetical protein
MALEIHSMNAIFPENKPPLLLLFCRELLLFKLAHYPCWTCLAKPWILFIRQSAEHRNSREAGSRCGTE